MGCGRFLLNRYAVVLDRLGDEEGARAARLNAYAMGLGQGGKGAN
jgi:hypothetical protein